MPAVTAAAVAAAYNLGQPTAAPVAAARGEQGVIWRIDTSAGCWAAKQLLLGADEDDAARDVAFQHAALVSGLSLPPPRLTRSGRVVLPAAQAGWDSDVRVYQWADLAEEPPVTGADIGAVLAALHRVPGQGPGLQPADLWFSEPSGESALAALQPAADRAGEPWADMLGRRLNELSEAESVIRPPDLALLRTCHRDVNLENVRRAALGGGLVVLDWENSGPAEPARELAAALADLAADAGQQAAADAWAGYRAASGPARLTRPADFTMAVAVQGHLLQFYGLRALDPGENADTRARARRRLHRMLDQPVTLQLIGRLLDLASG
jgi:hypothetical protein